MAARTDDAIEVRRHGTSGPPLVVLHGGPGAPGSAEGLARALSGDFQVLEPLQRRSGVVPLTVSRHVEDLRAVLQRPATLVGWSWGAMLGLSFAARYPEDVTALVLVGCGTYDERSRSLYRRSLEQRLGESERQRVQALEERLASESNARARDALFGELGAVYMEAESHEPLDVTGFSAHDLAADEAGYRETWNDVLRLQREGIEPAAFRAISSRVLMIHGAVDPHPGVATRDVLSEFISQLEYVELDRCGHEPWRERHARDRFLEIVRSWLAAS
jgi:pimeloyl-ACP methyl ester carboxylesterase